MTRKDNLNFQDQVDVPETDTAKTLHAQTPEQALQYNGAPVWKRELSTACYFLGGLSMRAVTCRCLLLSILYHK